MLLCNSQIDCKNKENVLSSKPIDIFFMLHIEIQVFVKLVVALMLFQQIS